MGTLVTFHAHPDDEAIACGGTMAKAASEGHRVVLVSATKGENGEVAEDFLSPGEPLWERRVVETKRAAEILGAARVEFLGYVDSGMMGTPENDDPASFWQADVEEAARRLAAILEEERADVLTIYDDNGSYGHPDHIQVHRVGARAAELAGTRKVYESVISREGLARNFDRLRELGIDPPFDITEIVMGVPEALITSVVDVSAQIDQKRAAMKAHESQIPETSFFLSMPPELFAEAFAAESYVLRGAPEGLSETSLFDGLT